MRSRSVDFEEALLSSLFRLMEGLAPPRRLFVAFSGGRDSSALLHALAAQRERLPCSLVAVHVDHQLQAGSAAWAAHCAQQADAHKLPFMALTLPEAPEPGESVEAWAREARYRAFADMLEADDLLLTAHHQDDQAESFLLAALRGSGPAGLRGISPRRRLGAGWLLRPMLELPAVDIEAFAREQDLAWIDDPMNTDAARARSFLRAEILPRLRGYWPAAGAVLARASQWQGETQAALEACAEQSLQALVTPEGALPVAGLQALALPLRSVVLRHWIRARGFVPPDARRLGEILNVMLSAAPDRVPEVTWGGVCLRRWQQALHLAPPAAVARFALRWNPVQALFLPGGKLSARSVTGEGLRQSLCSDGLTVRSREGGERCRLPGRGHHTTVKHVLQALRVPPWRRPALPFVYAGDRLVAVGDLFVCAEALAGPDEAGWLLEWQEDAPMGIVGAPREDGRINFHD